MKRQILIVAAAAAAIFTTACSKIETTVAAQPALIQDKICEVRDWSANATAECKPGQKVAFLPGSWGNEQLPLLFAAVNCDMRYSVAMTNGGVVCIHAKMAVEKAAPESPAAGAGK